jgi:transcription antitermination factor NusA-like protein
MEQVALYFTKGHNYTEIAERLGIRRVDVVRYHQEWQKFLANMAKGNPDIRDRIMQILLEADQSFALVVKEAWATVEQADQANELANKNGAMKLVATVTKDRAKLALDAGVGQNQDLAEQLEETQRQHEVLTDILREVTGKCAHCKVEVRRRLSQISSQAEVIDVSSDMVD